MIVIIGYINNLKVAQTEDPRSDAEFRPVNYPGSTYFDINMAANGLLRAHMIVDGSKCECQLITFWTLTWCFAAMVENTLNQVSSEENH